MRLAFALRSLARRDDMLGVVDATTTADLRRDGHDVVVFVDELGPGADEARQAGVHVDVSPKRPVDIDGWKSADEVVAHHIGDLHERSPFDAVVVSGELGYDPGWFDPRLAEVPLGITVGEELHRTARLALEDPDLRRASLPGIWAAAGALTAADFLVGSAPPDAYGFEVEPPPVLTPAEPPPGTAPVPANVSLLAVLATSADRTRLMDVVPATWQQVGNDPRTTTAVIVSDVHLNGPTVGQLVTLRLDREDRERVIVVPVGSDGAAAALVAAADLVVVSERAEIAHPLLTSIDTPLAAHFEGEIARPAGRFPTDVSLDTRRRSRTVISGDLDALDRGLDEVDSDVIILSDPRGASQAARLYAYPRLGDGLTFLGRPAPIHGAAEPTSVSPFSLAVGRSSVPVIRLAIREATDLWDLICTLLNPIHSNHLHIRVLPVGFGEGTRDLVGPTSRLRLPGRGPLRVDAEVILPGAPVRPTSPPVKDLRTWARESTWSDRARLALPWKFGLLRQAMKGRWS